MFEGTPTTESESMASATAFNEGGNSCSLKGAVFFSFGIQDAMPVLHAGPGCSYCAYFGVVYHSGESYPFTNTGMCSNEVIFGGEETLREGIRAAAEIHAPKIIVVASGCQAMTIGDDIDGVISEIDQEGLVAADVISSGTGGYDGDLYDGFTRTGVSFLKYYCRERPVRKKTVNIIGFPAHIHVNWKGDIQEIRRIVSALGLKVNCFFPGDATADQIRDIPAAELNLVVDEHLGIDMAQYLKEQYGTPYVSPPFGSLIGTDNTWAFFNQVVELLRLPPDALMQLDERRRHALQMAGQCHHAWLEIMQHATTFAVCAHSAMALGLTRMLMNEFGLEPEVINLNPSRLGSREKALELMTLDGRGFEPVIMENKDNYEMSRAFGDIWPTIILAKGTRLKSDAFMNESRAFMSVSYPVLDRIAIYNRPMMGFNGVPALWDDIVNRTMFFY